MHTADVASLAEVFCFDPESRPLDKTNGCGEIWELPFPEDAHFSLAYCRMKGPSTPHYNTHVDELYIPDDGTSVFVKAGKHGCRDTEIGPSMSAHVRKETPHAVVPIDPVVSFYLVTVPPYQSDGPGANRSLTVIDGVNHWSEPAWVDVLERVAIVRGLPCLRAASVHTQCRKLVNALTVS